MRALVADDDSELLDLVCCAIKRLGIDVVCVPCGDLLLDKIANHGPFDLIVTDVQMPWMTGIQVMHSARAAGLPVPVVVMTASRDAAFPGQVRSMGLHAELLLKPFTLDALYLAIDRCLSTTEGMRYWAG